MKKTLTALLALTALAAAAPAMAQDYRGEGRGYDRGYDRSDDRVDDRYGRSWGSDLRGRYERIEARIQRGLRNRTLSYREGDRLRQQLRELRHLDRRYRVTDGRLTRWEQNDLEQRAERLERRVRSERRDGDDRRY